MALDTSSPRDSVLSLLANGTFSLGLTTEQATAVERFRQLQRQRGGHLLQPCWDNALIARRFCVACDLDASRAIEMLAENIAWREQMTLQYKKTECESAVPALLSELRIPAIEAVKRVRQCTFHKTDRCGRPVCYDRVGRLRLADIESVVSIDTMIRYAITKGADARCLASPRLAPSLHLACGSRPPSPPPHIAARYHIWSLEATLQWRLPAASLAAGRLISHSVFVLDLEGFSIGAFNALRWPFNSRAARGFGL